jgi:electron transport complex protein RnfB
MKRLAVALIDEGRCIGCTLCIDACPVDAIVGAQTLIHTVVEPWCIGCGLCLPPCPVDCIEMLQTKSRWSQSHKTAAKSRALQRKKRLERNEFKSESGKDPREVIAAALARKRRS